MTKTLYDKLKHLTPCPKAVPYLKQFGADEIKECWDDCERSDWLLWLLREVNYGKSDDDDDDKNTLRKIAVRCAAGVTYLMDDELDSAALGAWAAVDSAVDSAAWAARAADAAVWSAATDTMRSRQADIIREYITGDDVKRLKGIQ